MVAWFIFLQHKYYAFVAWKKGSVVFMSIQLVIVVVYIALLFGISLWVKHKADSGSTAFLLAGRKLNTILVAVNVTGLAVGAASTVGVAQRAFSVGLAAGWYNGAWSIGAIVMGLLAAGKLRSMKVSTIPEFFEFYYDTKGRAIAAIGLVIIMCVITALQYMAGGAILSSLLPEIFSFHGGMIMSAVVFIGITLIGGLWSSGLANIVSVTLIYIGIIYSAIQSVSNVGGWDAVLSKLPNPEVMGSPVAGLAFATILGWIIVMITQTITAQGPVQIACGAKNVKAARNGYVLAGLMIFPVGFICAVLGVVCKAMYPEMPVAQAALAMPKVVMTLDPLAGGVTLAALWAADVSTACNLLLSAGTLFSSDIYKRFINPQCDQARQLLMTRACIIISGILTLGLAMSVSSILGTIMIGLSLTAAFSVIVIVALFFPQYASKAAGFWTLLAGLVLLVLWQLTPAVRIFPNVIYMEWLVCIAAYAIAAIVCPAKKAVAVEGN